MEKTTALIAANAKKLELTSRWILQDHYMEVIDMTVAKLLALPDTPWRQSFCVAENWA